MIESSSDRRLHTAYSGFLAVLSQVTALLAIGSYFLIPYFPSNSPTIFGKIISVTQVLLIVASGLLALCVWRRIHMYGIVLPKKILHIFLTLGLFAVVLASSTLFAQGFSRAGFAHVASVVGILISFIVAASLRGKALRIFFIGSAWISIVASILGIVQFFFLGDVAAPAAYLGQAHRAFNATGFANLSSVFGASLALFLPLFLGLGAFRYGGRRIIWSIAFGLGVSALLLTFSRTALFGTIIALLLLTAWLLVIRQSRSYVVSMLVLAIVVSWGTLAYTPSDHFASETFLYHASAFEILEKRFEFITSTSPFGDAVSPAPGDAEISLRTRLAPLAVADFSAYSRYTFYAVAAKMLIDSPFVFVFGYGVGGFNEHWEQFRDAFGTPSGLDPHSTFIELTVGSGIVGFILFTVFIWMLFLEAWRTRDVNPIVIPLVAGIVGILIDGVFHTHLYTKYLWFALGVLMALIIATASHEEIPSSPAAS